MGSNGDAKLSKIVATVGLGYVGLPLALAFAEKYPTIGFDLSKNKIESYLRNIDPSGEVDSAAFASVAGNLTFTTDPGQLAQADYIIVAVPTPVDAAHVPDLDPLRSASRTVGTHMKRGATVIFESTVYPGTTEEVCVPILEATSGLKWKTDFSVGYSPERINPGDKKRTLRTIVKVVSGDSTESSDRVADLYNSIIHAGIYRASSIKVAEAAKVIENTQRDLNIALMNELAIIFDKLGIDTREVLDAAGTKWNFLPFTPGLVGGHCIGVDPYYLTHKAEMVGYHPQVILAGRRINDGMAAYVAQQTVKGIIDTGKPVKGAKVIVLGLTFKEDCVDLRNSKVADLVNELEGFGCAVSVHDPIADAAEAKHEYGIELSAWNDLPDQAAAVVAAVSHSHYKDLDFSQIMSRLQIDGIFVDVKSAYDPKAVEASGRRVWRL